MHKVIITEPIHKLIYNFIDSYENTFLNLFTDTGIYYEDLIRQNYIDNSKKFQRDIYLNIKNILQEKTIFGYKILENKKFQVVVSTGNYKLFVEYGENSKERFVENIIFNRK